jgi:hypothetical protein
MEKLYHLIFFKTYNFFKAISDDGWSDWKALVFVSGANILIVLSIDIYIKVFFKKGFILELPYLIFVLLFGVISAINYAFFMYSHRWRKYEDEFLKYSKRKSSAYGWLTLFFYICVLGNIIFAFYQMSLIDWSLYR